MRKAEERVKPRPNGGSSRNRRSRPRNKTFEEPKYLKQLIDKQIPVCVKLSNNEEVSGTIELLRRTFIRLTRDGEPNSFSCSSTTSSILYEVPE